MVLPDWPRGYLRASDEKIITAQIRTSPEDFRVDENLSFTPDGTGEHLLVRVQKRLRNTQQVARKIAQHTGVRVRDVGYCGLKDRRAVTSQWFSVWLPGKPDPDFSAIEDEDLQFLGLVRHGRKLQRGTLKSNQFVITLRDMQGDHKSIEGILGLIQQQGVPNYFGEQRFGRDGDNLNHAVDMFNGKKIKDRHLRSLYLSSARSFLFNEVLARRVYESNWNEILPGEAVMLSGSRSYFLCDEVNEEILQRLASGDIHPSGPLWGKGDLPSQGECATLERKVLSSYELFCSGLEQAGMKQERRALRVLVNGLQWNWLAEDVLQLEFSLPAGSYATSVLREICDYQ